MKFRHKAVVLGTGSIGYRHMQVLKSLQVPVIAIPVRESRRTELQSQRWTCAGSMREAKEAGATFAVIATDTKRHAADAEEAFSLGLHVLLEKPMACSVTQARHLPRLAAEASLSFFIACPLRFDPGLEALRHRLPQVGAVHAARIECRSYLPDWRPTRDHRQAYSSRAEEGGVLRDLIHEIDYALWLFGAPRQVFGTLQNLGRLGIQSDETAEGQWVNSAGASITLGLDYLSRHARRTLSVYGENGELEYDFILRKLRLQEVGSSPQEMTFAKTSNDLYLQQMSEFLHIIAGESPHVIASAEDGVNALAVCDAWRHSATSNHIEQVLS